MEANNIAPHQPHRQQLQRPTNIASVSNNNDNDINLSNSNNIAGRSNKSGSPPSNFVENDYQSITEWTQKLCLEKREEDAGKIRETEEKRRRKEGQGKMKGEEEEEEQEQEEEGKREKKIVGGQGEMTQFYDKDGDCVKVRSKGNFGHFSCF